MSDYLIQEFYEMMTRVNFNVLGMINSDNQIFTLGTDSKIIGRIFEMLTQPVVAEMAARHNLRMKTPESQTIYPDFVMMRNESSSEKIAIDVKTTYINNQSPIKFTLGSFASYMRNNTKNIEYTYTDYAKHYVIGFVYRRNDIAQGSRIYNYADCNNISCPFCDVRYFIQEKYKIAGDRPGSGNTENIGSISTRNFDDFIEGRGPFSELGADVFDLYWKYFPKYRNADRTYTSLNEFLVWLPNQNNLELLHSYNQEEVLRSVERYNQAHQRTR